jgi:hypothetical protein
VMVVITASKDFMKTHNFPVLNQVHFVRNWIIAVKGNPFQDFYSLSIRK